MGTAPPIDQFYGLREPAFGLTSDRGFTYPSHSHSHALQQVSEGLQRREELIVVTGEPGIGKTTLCRTLLGTFESRTFVSAILDPCRSVDALLHQVLTDFGLMIDANHPMRSLTEVTRHQLMTTLQRFLASLVPLGAHAVIVIDEAQDMDATLLDTIRLLSNFESGSARLLQVVLVGEPALNSLLRRHDMRALAQRIAGRLDLRPLDGPEVAEYIEHRIAAAAAVPPPESGETPPLFTPEAALAVAAISRGIPALVNLVCEGALDVGRERTARTIDPAIVLAGAKRSGLRIPASFRLRRVPGLRTAAAAIERAAGKPRSRS